MTSSQLDIHTLRLSQKETSQLSKLAANQEAGSLLDFVERAALLVEMLPQALRSTFLRFRREEPREGVLLVRGVFPETFPLEPTPMSLGKAIGAAPLQERLLILCGSALGDPFAWTGQQAGALVHNVLPMQAHASAQVGASSTVELAWHTEDAFHSARADYILLLCLRNPDRVGTTVAHLAGLNAHDSQWDVLFENRFLIRPDAAYFAAFSRMSGFKTLPHRHATAQALTTMSNSPSPTAVFFGRKSDPYLRIDPEYMTPAGKDRRAQEGLNRLISVIQERLFTVTLTPGDLLVIDNFRAVHGRKPFLPRYDGSDRWLKRLNVARDLRRSAGARASAISRMVET